MKEVLATEVVDTIANTTTNISSVVGNIVPVLLFVAVFYFLIIRPQQKKAKEHTEEVKNLKVGDKVVTDGGIFGKVVKVKEEFITIEISDGVNIDIIPNMVNLIKK